MPFPETTRVIYSKNPLEQVICQLRFQPILKIDAELPAAFQERIRAQFPNFTESYESRLQAQQALQGQVPAEIVSHIVRSSNIRNYEFSSEKGSWKMNLTRTFLALTTNRYWRWEEFKEKLQDPLDALISIYNPTHFTRIGLRYIDVVHRSKLGLENVSWEDLLQSYVLGILGAPKVGEHVIEQETSDEVGLSDAESKVRIVTRFIIPEKSNERCFVIDSDFYSTKKVDSHQVTTKLDYFNNQASRLIRWCITDRLHNAMEPEELS